MLGVAVVMMFLTCRALRLQSKATDASSYLDLMTRFSGTWRRFLKAKTDEDKSYEFFEFLNLIEASCDLSQRGILGSASNKMLMDRLKEHVRDIVENEYGKYHLNQGVSGPETFSAMKKFAKEHDIPWLPLQPPKDAN